MMTMSDEVVKMEVTKLRPHPENREVVTEGEEWESFVASINRHGVLTPLLVRPLDEGFEIVAGERRWRAAKWGLGLEVKVPCIVRDLSDAEALELMMVENLQREDLDPVEEARGVRLLVEQAGLTCEEVGERICKSAEWVELRQGLLDLPVEAQDRAREGAVALSVLQMVMHLPEGRREDGLQLVLHPAFQEQPLDARQAEQILEAEIIEPERMRREWEERHDALRSHWKAELHKRKRSGSESPLVHVAAWNEKAKGQAFDDKIYAMELTAGAPEGLTWLDLAIRHSLLVVIYPGRVEHENEKLRDSVAMVNDRLILEGEKALERHERGSAWLSAAVKAVTKEAPPEKVDPEEREDLAEAQREEARESQEVKMGAELSGWVDMGKVRAAQGLIERYLRTEGYLDPLPDWFPEVWTDFEGGGCALEFAEGVESALSWVISLVGEKAEEFEKGEEE